MSAIRTSAPGRSLEQLVDDLDISEDQKVLLRSRWLDQMRWMSGKSHEARRRHQALRWTIGAGGVVLPTLVSFSLGAGQSEVLRWITFTVSLAIALLAATEEILHYGDRWHHYRRVAERLKSAGWQYVQLTGPHAGSPTHAAALPAFTKRVEEILSEDVEEYFGALMEDQSGTRPGIMG